MKYKDDPFKEVPLSQKEQIIEIMAVTTVALLLIGCMAKVLFF